MYTTKILSKFTIGVVLLTLFISSCKEVDKYNQKPELESLRQGIKACTAIGYCGSLVYAAANGYPLPANVSHTNGSSLIYVNINESYPLPFNNNIGDIAIAFKWSGNSGVMSILYADIDIIGGNIKLYGLQTVPIMKQAGENLTAIFAKQDIIVGSGSDTILNIGNMTDIAFDTEIGRLNSTKPGDSFVAAKQNVWFVDIDQNSTYSNVYDDDFIITGGGQIAEVIGESGGIIYHGMINTRINYTRCNLNPISGLALSQNFKAGGEPYVDLGNSLLSFDNNCDGKAHVEISTGKYLYYNGKDVSLNLR